MRKEGTRGATTDFADVPIEEVRSYWDRRPCNIRHSSREVGTREYFDEVEARRYFVESHIPEFCEFPKWRGKRVLELGCGIGTDTISFAREGALVTAVDLSSASLDVARRRSEVYGFEDRITFYQGNLESLDEFVPVEPYDLVYSFGVIHHTPNPGAVMERIKRYLTPETSELRIMIYARASYKTFWILHTRGEWDMNRLDEIVARDSEAQEGCPVTYTYTYSSARRLLAGFDIVSMAKDHIFTWDIEEYRNYRYKKDPAWENVSDEELGELAKEVGWHLLVKARLTAQR